MRKNGKSIDEIKNEIYSLKGKQIKIVVSKGRKKTTKYLGSVTALYPNIFILDIQNDSLVKQLSCTYKDVICGEVRFLVK